MASLRDIRTRINSVQNTQQVTRAMKMVAAAKLRRAQEAIFHTRPYAFKIGEIISHLKRHVDPSTHPLFRGRAETDAVLLVIVTADRGLAGAFNSNIIKVAEQAIQDQFAAYRDSGNLYLLCVGRKGAVLRLRLRSIQRRIRLGLRGRKVHLFCDARHHPRQFFASGICAALGHSRPPRALQSVQHGQHGRHGQSHAR